MKSKIMFSLLLILGSFSGSESSQTSCVQLAKQATCDAKCSKSDPSHRDYCKRQCSQQYLGPNITAGIQLKRVGNVSLDCHIPSGHTTDLRIKFNTVKDECYSYWVMCKQINGAYISNRTIAPTAASRWAQIFRRLPLGAEFTVSVQSMVGNITSNKTTIDFRTPLHQLSSSYPKKCVLPKVKNLKAKAIPTKGNQFNVIAYWDKPSPDIKLLTVTLKTDRGHIQIYNVSELNSRFTFKHTEPISRNYQVYVKASSWAGTGETVSNKFTVGEKKTEKNKKTKPDPRAGGTVININGSIATIIVGVLIGFGCAMVVAWFVYRQMKNRAEKERDSEGGSVADEDDFEEETPEE